VTVPAGAWETSVPIQLRLLLVYGFSSGTVVLSQVPSHQAPPSRLGSEATDAIRQLKTLTEILPADSLLRKAALALLLEANARAQSDALPLALASPPALTPAVPEITGGHA
jgi:hypothetical protein